MITLYHCYHCPSQFTGAALEQWTILTDTGIFLKVGVAPVISCDMPVGKLGRTFIPQRTSLSFMNTYESCSVTEMGTTREATTFRALADSGPVSSTGAGMKTPQRAPEGSLRDKPD